MTCIDRIVATMAKQPTKVWTNEELYRAVGGYATSTIRHVLQRYCPDCEWYEPTNRAYFSHDGWGYWSLR